MQNVSLSRDHIVCGGDVVMKTRTTDKYGELWPSVVSTCSVLWVHVKRWVNLVSYAAFFFWLCFFACHATPGCLRSQVQAALSIASGERSAKGRTALPDSWRYTVTQRGEERCVTNQRPSGRLLLRVMLKFSELKFSYSEVLGNEKQVDKFAQLSWNNISLQVNFNWAPGTSSLYV